MFGTKYLSSYGTYEFQAYFLHSSFDTLCNKKMGSYRMYVYLKIKITVKKIGHGLEHVKTNLRFFGLSLNFYSNF